MGHFGQRASALFSVILPMLNLNPAVDPQMTRMNADGKRDFRLLPFRPAGERTLFHKALVVSVFSAFFCVICGFQVPFLPFPGDQKGR